MNNADIGVLLNILLQLLTIGPEAVNNIIEALHRDKQLTDEEFAAFKTKWQGAMAAPHWQRRTEEKDG